jgi:hypothetical protein
MHIGNPFPNGAKRWQAGGIAMMSRMRARSWRLPRGLACYALAAACGLVLAVFVFISVSAASATLQARTLAEIDLDNGAVCSRLDFSPATQAYDRCLAELTDLRDRDRALQQDVY